MSFKVDQNQFLMIEINQSECKTLQAQSQAAQGVDLAPERLTSPFMTIDYLLLKEPTRVLVIGEESGPLAKNEKKESKKLTAWCGCSCASTPISRFFLGAELASDSSRDRRTACSLIAMSVIIWQIKGTTSSTTEHPHF